MKLQTPIVTASFCIACTIAMCLSAQSATFSSSATAPNVDSSDIANLASATGDDKWFFQTSNESGVADAAKGQTFTTGANALRFRSITYKINGANLKGATAANPTTWTIRLGTLSGNNFTVIRSETTDQTANSGTGHFMTWTFDNPVQLAPNTTYAVDVVMRSRTSWQTGIPYLSITGNVTTTGVGSLYNSGDLGVAAATVSLDTGNDRVFHVNLEDPVNPSPADRMTVPAGNVNLSWTNIAPLTGTDVWVDIWFGTNASALTRVVTAGLNLTSTSVSAPLAATYFWRIDTYRNGSATGTPSAGTRFQFSVTDTDADGITDVYELANTNPSSGTALVPSADDDNDGLTNMQEFTRGTRASLPDTDGDTLNDGPELTGVGSRPPTNPLRNDTDGDGLSDGAESNTRIWASSANTGTSPVITDTDADSLSDSVETNTRVFLSKTNTGTDPNDTDTDNDEAGDWYEVTASFTSPLLASEEPNVPYPLPDPDASAGNPSKKVKVYIMSGQSNMVGMGLVGGTDEKSLESMTLRQNKFPNLVNAAGAWTTRQDVQYRGVVTDVANAKLSAGSLGTKFGPELGFGQIMGWYHDEPVLLIKSSDGNRALSWDMLPHGTPSWVYGTTNYAGYGGFGNWPVGGSPPTTGTWYAGKEFDRFFKHESEWARPDTANTNVVDVLDNFATQYPSWAAQGFEIAGFVWWQGEKDGGDMGWATRYEANLVRLINSLRTYYSNRYPGKVVPDAPFVLATLGEAALSNTSPAAEVAVRKAHLAVDSATGSNPQINVKTVYSHPLSEGGSGNGHYDERAGTYMLVGDALGRAMIDLQSVTPPGNTFASWIAGYPSVPSNLAGFDKDADGDGIDNGAENFFGTNPGVGSSGLISGASSGNTFTFTHPQNATPVTGMTAAYRWSSDLATFRTHGQSDGAGTTVNFNAVTNAGVTTVTATVTGTLTAKLFVDVRVTQN